MDKINIIVTAGGVSEHIDKVRKITNSSSGKLGMIIANELLKTKSKINTIYYICSKDTLKPINDKVKVIEIDGTMDLKDNIEYLLTTKHIDYFIHSMAVADYMIDYVTNSTLLSKYIEEFGIKSIETAIIENKNLLTGNKISSFENNLIIMLKPTPKIISLIKLFSPETYLVGFKLLDGVSKNELIDVAKKTKG